MRSMPASKLIVILATVALLAGPSAGGVRWDRAPIAGPAILGAPCSDPAVPTTSERAEHGLAWDPDSERIIMFGGGPKITTGGAYKDTWALEGSPLEWVPLGCGVGGNGPGQEGRKAFAMASIPSPPPGTIILHSGNTNATSKLWDETWSFDGSATAPNGEFGVWNCCKKVTNCNNEDPPVCWTEDCGPCDAGGSCFLNTDPFIDACSDSPGGQQAHAAAYDSTLGKVVLYTGNSGGIYGDNGIWTVGGSNGTWSNECLDENCFDSGAPADIELRNNFAMAFHPNYLAGGRVLLHGGHSSDKTTWWFDGGKWTLSTNAGPGARKYHEMVYDTNTDLVILFGGIGGANSTELNDTWAFDDQGNWTELSANLPPYPQGCTPGVDCTEGVRVTLPNPTIAYGMGFDETRQVTVLFGGEVFSRAGAPAFVSDETWELGCFPPEIVVTPGNTGDTSTKFTFTEPSLLVPNYNPGSYTWDFGDACTLTSECDNGTGGICGAGGTCTATGQTVDHFFTNTGIYNVKVTVANDPCPGVADTAETTIRIWGNEPPEILVGPGPDSTATPVVSGFAYNATDDRVEPWEFTGASGPGPDINPYGAPGFGSNVAAGRLLPCEDDHEFDVPAAWGDCTPYVTTASADIENCGAFKDPCACCDAVDPPISCNPGTDCDTKATDQTAYAVTGPGPGAVFGPHIRAFKPAGDGVGKINFYAYGTLKFGVNPGVGHLKGDPFNGPNDTGAEILTGAGPGAVFGPHVRGWDFDETVSPALNAMPGISIFAYGTLKWGVNVAAGNIEKKADSPGTSNSWDEIITGPGPGVVFGPQVRAFRTPPVVSIDKVNFNAYSLGFYGVSVASGNIHLSNDGSTAPEVRDEIVTAPGPDPNTLVTTELRAWDFVGSLARRDDDAFDRFAFEGSINGYGATLAVGTGDAPTLGNEGADLLIAGARHVDSDPHVRGFEFHDLGGTNPDFDPLTVNIDFKPFLAEGAWGYGARVAAVPKSEPFLPNSPLTVGMPWLASAKTPTDHLILIARQFAQDIPDSTYVCDFCCEGTGCDPDPPPIPGQWNEWGSDAQKELALDEMDELYHGLPDYVDGAAVATQIDVIKALVNDPALGVQSTALRDELLGQLDDIRSKYFPMTFPSTGVTAELTWDDLETPSDIALSGVDHRLYIRPGSALAGKVQSLDTAGLFFYSDRTVPTGDGEVMRLTVPTGRREVFLTTTRDCPLGVCSDYALERLSVPGTLLPDSGYLDLMTFASTSIKANDMHVTPPSSVGEGLKDGTAWIAFDDAGTGSIKSVVGVTNLSTAVVSTVGVASRVYVAMAPAPQGGQKLYVAHAGGIDSIKTKDLGQPTTSNELTYPLGFGAPKDMTSGITADAKKRIFVVSDNKLGAWEPTAESKFKGEVTLLGDAVAVNLTADGRFVLVTRHPISTSGGQPVTSLSTYNADTLALVRHNDTAICEAPGPCPVPPPSPVAMAIDGTNGFIADPLHEQIEYLYFDPPNGSLGQARSRKARLVGAYLVNVIEAVKTEAFLSSSDKTQMAGDATLAEGFLALAELAPNEASRKAHLSQAEAIFLTISERVDGCFGRDDSDDVISDCDEALNIYLVVSRLLTQTQSQLLGPPTSP